MPLPLTLAEQPLKTFRRRSCRRALTGHGARHLLPDAGEAGVRRRGECVPERQRGDSRLRERRMHAALPHQGEGDKGKCGGREGERHRGVNARTVFVQRDHPAGLGLCGQKQAGEPVKVGSGYVGRQKTVKADFREGHQHPRRVENSGSAGRCKELGLPLLHEGGDHGVDLRHRCAEGKAADA